MIMMSFAFLQPGRFARIVVYNTTRDYAHAAEQHGTRAVLTILFRSVLSATAFCVCLSRVVLDMAAAIAVGGMGYAVKS
jgi:hypothetical protein